MMQKCIAELFGTFALVFAGTGAIIVNDVTGGLVSHVGIAFTFGLVIMAMIYALGDISGAHFNPAVTFGFWLARRFPGCRVFLYFLSQCTGALLASGILRMLFVQHPTLGITVPAGAASQSFILETILTFLLVFVILSVSTGAKEKGLMAGAAIGAVIALEALFAGPISGASMNPARSLALALVTRYLDTLWIYVTAPFLGAGLAVLGWQCVQEKDNGKALPEESNQ